MFQAQGEEDVLAAWLAEYRHEMEELDRRLLDYNTRLTQVLDSGKRNTIDIVVANRVFSNVNKELAKVRDDIERVKDKFIDVACSDYQIRLNKIIELRRVLDSFDRTDGSSTPIVEIDKTLPEGSKPNKQSRRLQSGVVIDKASDFNEVIMSMAKADFPIVPKKLVTLMRRVIHGVLDDWFSENSKKEDKKWVRKYKVYGNDFYFGFRPKYISKSQAERDPDDTEWEFVMLFFSTPEGDCWYKTGYTNADLQTIYNVVEDEVTVYDSPEQIVLALQLVPADVDNPLNYIQLGEDKLNKQSRQLQSGLQGIARKIYKEIQKDINPKKDTIQKIKDEARLYLKEYEGELTFRDEEDVMDKVVQIAKGTVQSGTQSGGRHFAPHEVKWMVDDYTHRKECKDEWYDIVSYMYKCKKTDLEAVLNKNGIKSNFTRVVRGRTNSGVAKKNIYFNTYYLGQGERADVTLQYGDVFLLQNSTRGMGHLVLDDDETIFDYFQFD
jgi:hypothetical protein